MTKRPPYSPEVRASAVRMVLDHQGAQAWQWAARARRFETGSGSPRGDKGLRGAPSTDERARIKALEREDRERRQANEILRKASAYFAMAERDRWSRTGSSLSTTIAAPTGSRRSAGSCRSPRRRTLPSCSTRWSRPCTNASPSRVVGSCTISDRGSQYRALRYTERLAEAGVEPSVGASATATTTPRLRRSTACSRPR